MGRTLALALILALFLGISSALTITAYSTRDKVATQNVSIDAREVKSIAFPDGTTSHYYILSIPSIQIKDYDFTERDIWVNLKSGRFNAMASYPIEKTESYQIAIIYDEKTLISEKVKIPEGTTQIEVPKDGSVKIVSYQDITAAKTSALINTDTFKQYLIEINTSSDASGEWGAKNDYFEFDPDISACGTLNSPNSVYTLTANAVASGGSCFSIEAQNITLNCNGFSIIGDLTADSYGIESFNNLTNISNCIISNFSEGIVFNNISNSTIQNTSITANLVGIRLYKYGLYNSGRGLIINGTNASNSYGLLLNGEISPAVLYNTFSNFNITARWGITIDNDADNNTFSNYRINAGDMAIQFHSIGGTGNTFANGTLIGSGNAVVGASSGTSHNNNIFYNNTITSLSSANLVELAGVNNTLYWNNFSQTNGTYISGSDFNYYNTTINGHGEGNIYYSVEVGQHFITAVNSSDYGGGYLLGNAGADYPFNNTTSDGKVSGGTDYAPLTFNLTPQTNITILIQPTFTNSTIEHSFLVFASINATNGGENITATNSSNANCTYLSNSSAGYVFNVTYNCSNTIQKVESVRLGFTDVYGSYGQTNTASNSYPGFAVIGQPSISPATPNASSIVNCTNGTFTSDDMTENTSSRVWTWYYNGIPLNESQQTFSLLGQNVSKGGNLSCQEITTGSNWGQYAFGNTSNNTTLGNAAPTANVPLNTYSGVNYIYVNCTAKDLDGGIDIAESTLTSTNGTPVQISNGTADKDFWALWNITALTPSTPLNATCGFNDTDGEYASSTASLASATPPDDSFGLETQAAYAIADSPIGWNQTYSTTDVDHTCYYSPLKTDFQQTPAPTMRNALGTIISANTTATTISWICNGADSPYSMTFYTSPIALNSSTLSSSALGLNPVKYILQPNKTLTATIDFQFYYPQNSSNRKLWRCTLNNATTCNANDYSLWVQQSFSETNTGTGIYSDSYFVVSSQMVLITTNDGASGSNPGGYTGGGGGGGGANPPGIIENLPAIQGLDFSQLEAWFKGKTSGIPNIFISIGILLLILYLNWKNKTGAGAFLNLGIIFLLAILLFYYGRYLVI